MGPIDGPGLIIILIIVLLLFGARRLPELGRSLGSSLREFKDGVSGGDGDSKSSKKDKDASDSTKTAAENRISATVADPADDSTEAETVASELVDEGPKN